MQLQLKEEEFFKEIESDAEIEFAVARCVLDLAKMRRELLALEARGEYPRVHEKSMARHFTGFSNFRGFCEDFKSLKNSVVARGIDNLPKMLFSRLSPAVHFILKAFCRYLKKDREGVALVSDVLVNFDAFKDCCRYDTQPDGMDAETFTVEVNRLYRELENAAVTLAKFVERFELMQTAFDEDRPTATASTAASATGKGHSKSAHIGETYNGVSIGRDQSTVRIGGETLTITSKANWKIVDAVIDAYFSGAWAKVPTRAFSNFTTPDEKKFLAYVEREEYRVGDPSRRGNRRYTGRVKLSPLKGRNRKP